MTSKLYSKWINEVKQTQYQLHQVLRSISYMNKCLVHMSNLNMCLWILVGCMKYQMINNYWTDIVVKTQVYFVILWIMLMIKNERDKHQEPQIKELLDKLKHIRDALGREEQVNVDQIMRDYVQIKQEIKTYVSC